MLVCAPSSRSTYLYVISHISPCGPYCEIISSNSRIRRTYTTSGHADRVKRIAQACLQKGYCGRSHRFLHHVRYKVLSTHPLSSRRSVSTVTPLITSNLGRGQRLTLKKKSIPIGISPESPSFLWGRFGDFAGTYGATNASLARWMSPRVWPLHMEDGVGRLSSHVLASRSPPVAGSAVSSWWKPF
jgi:hypothetical protein